MAGVAVVVMDKAVSTEDLGVVTRDIHLEVARLEAMLNTLVENKVESLKADNKDKDKNNKQRITSTSTTASSTGAPGRRHHHRGRHHHKHESSHRHRHRHHHEHREVTGVYCEHDAVATVVEASDDDELMMDEAFDFLAYHDQDQLQDQADECHCSCGCPIDFPDDNQIMKLPYEEYISIPIELPCDLVDEPLALLDCSSDSARRSRRRRRRRRRKRRRRLAAAAAVSAAAAAQAEQRRKQRKTLDDDLPQRARWTIVATACLLLVMCLTLVGVTLRMAPIIDDMGLITMSYTHSPSPSLSGSLTPSPWPSRPPSASPSPSSSFRVSTARLLARKHTAPCVRVCKHQASPLPRASSLDDVTVYRSHRSGGHHHRSASARSSGKRRRRSSACSTRSVSRRASAVVPDVPLPEILVEKPTLEDKEKYRRHRIAFWLILGSFIFIAISSILVVVVTLTHTSQYMAMNQTKTYYTFAKPSFMATNRTKGK